ncbi:MAG: M15 family metallopeptidase [Cyanobacteria bacterium J06627_32]
MLSKLLYRLPRQIQPWLLGAITALTIVSVGLFTSALLPAQTEVSQGLHPASESSAPAISVSPLPAADSTASSFGGAASSQAVATPAAVNDDIIAKFNHLPYPEADRSRIVSIGLFVRESYQREEFLDFEAAQAFIDMSAAARRAGIGLIPISGFRTIDHQAALFDEQVEKQGGEATAAQVSAPPGHSEHHTGYAIDIGDATRPDADIKHAFELTPAYAWLLGNAHVYGFELSFPRDNQQGVSFEPWHWRFVGSEQAKAAFTYSRSLFP